MYACLGRELWKQTQYSCKGVPATGCVSQTVCFDYEELKSSSLPEDGSSRPWADLTESVLTEILQACSLRDACALRTVCRHWQNVHRKLQLSLCPPGPLNSGALLLAAPYARGLSLSKAAQAAGGDILPTELGALSGFRHLRSLSLAGCKAVSAEALSALSGLGHTVASLDLSGCSGVDDTVLSKILGGRGLSGLLELDLSDCEQWTAPGLASALSQPRAPQLRTLALRRCCEQVGCDGGELLTPLAAALGGTLLSLDLGGCERLADPRCLESFTVLRTLSLARCTSLEDAAVAEALPRLTSLQHLDLSFCPTLLPGGALSAIGTLTRLRSLSLAACVKLTEAAVCATAPQLPRLESISLAWCTELTDEALAPLSRLPALTSVNLSGCSRVTGAGVRGLARGLPSLAELRLAHCHGVAGRGLWSELAAAHRLRVLSLAGISWAGAATDALSGLRLLSDLDLGGCRGVDDEAIACFVASSGAELRRLSLQRCGITDEALRSLSCAPSLASLDLRHCRRISEAGVLSLFASCRSLTSVDARGCHQLKDRPHLLEKAACKRVHIAL
mmetsp:Transcript_18572/g.44411  ORF Transcript_18572/g.44411 Transcript_18572/m.44411 type:complete len:563 (+) Transcript_18572:484-2172(+)